MIERVLVALDGSEDSEAALSGVRPLLRRRSPEVVLVRVALRPPADLHYSVDSSGLVAEADGYLAKVETDLRSDGFRARRLVTVGVPAESILEAAERERADLLALATHGRSGLARAVLGSVAESVVRHTTKPVWLTRSGVEEPIRENVRTILAPLDGSLHSEQAIPVLVDLGRTFDARLVLYHAFPPRPNRSELEVPTQPLEPARRLLEAAGVAAECDFGEGDAAERTLQAAHDVEADLIVVATHGRTGIRRLVLGSVAERILRRAAVPVVVVRPAEKGEVRK